MKQSTKDNLEALVNPTPIPLFSFAIALGLIIRILIELFA